MADVAVGQMSCSDLLGDSRHLSNLVGGMVNCSENKCTVTSPIESNYTCI